MTFEPGDTAEVSEGLADHLVTGVGSFKYSDGADTTPNDGGATDDDDAAEEDPLEGKPVAETNVAKHLDRWLDQHYTHRAEQIRTGAVDGSLDEIEAAETSDTVIDAVDKRRAELEG